MNFILKFICEKKIIEFRIFRPEIRQIDFVWKNRVSLKLNICTFFEVEIAKGTKLTKEKKSCEKLVL